MRSKLKIWIALAVTTVFNTSVGLSQITFSQDNPCAPVLTKFANSRKNIKSYFWDFDGKSTSLLASPEIFYAKSGKQTILCHTWDSLGNNYSDTLILTLYNPPKADITISQNTACPDKQLNFYDQSTIGVAPIRSYFLSYGDGVTDSTKNPSHKYTASGNYGVTYYVKDTFGCESSVYKLDFVKILSPPKLELEILDDYHCKAPHLVQFKNRTTGATPITYDWQFGDGGTSTSYSSTHTYTSTGKYDIALQAKDNNGCMSNFTKKNAVILGDLLVDFKSDRQSLCSPDYVTFTNLTFPNSDSLLYTWKIGGNTYSGKNITPFIGSGTHDVTLKASKSGCEDSVVKPSHIFVQGQPTGKIIASDSILCSAKEVRYYYTQKTYSTLEWYVDDQLKFVGDDFFFTPGRKDSFKISAVFVTPTNCRIKLENKKLYYLPPALQINSTMNQCVDQEIKIVVKNNSFFPLTSRSYLYTNDNIKTTVSTVSNLFKTFRDTGNYNLVYTIQDINKCTLSLSEPLAPGYRLKADTIKVSKTFLCPRDTINLTDLTVNQYILPHAKSWAIGSEYSFNNTMILKDQFDSLDLKLIYRHFGCSDTFTQYNKVYVFPLKANITITDSCSAYKTLQPIFDVNRANKFELTYPNKLTYVNLVPAFKVEPGNGFFSYELWNDTFGCNYRDTAIFRFYDSIVAQINITTDTTCAPVNVRVDFDFNTTPNLIVWNLNQDEIRREDNIFSHQHQFKVVRAGLQNVAIDFTSRDGCRQIFNDSLQVFGPTAQPSVTFLDSCLPVRVIIKDSLYNNEFTRFWLAGADTLYQTDISISAIVKTPNEIRGRPNISYHVLDNNGCAFKQVFPYGGKTFTADVEQEVFQTCTYPRYRLLLFANSFSFASIKWIFDDSIIQKGSRYGNIQFMSSGKHKYFVEWQDANGCINALSDYIIVPEANIKANFSVLDRHLHCAPKVFQFIDKSTSTYGVAKYDWVFTNGEKGTVSNPQLLVQTIGEFDAQLNITDSLGCKDSFSVKNAVLLSGPAIDFSTVDSLGCQPYFTEFIVNLASNEKAALYPNDGGKLEIQGSGKYGYTYFSKGKFTPYIQLTDSLNCKASKEAPNSITVLEKPLAAADVSDKCAYKSVTIKSLSRSGTGVIAKNSWLSPKLETSDEILVNLPLGSYPVTLISENDFGCKDTFYGIQKLYGDTVQAKASKDRLCETDSLIFTAMFKRDTSIVSSEWSIDGAKTTGDSIKFKLKKAGVVKGIYSYTNALGCQYLGDTISVTGESLTAKTEPNLDFISVLNDNTLEIQHQQVGFSDFKKYRLKLHQTANNYWEVIENNDIAKTTYQKFPLPYASKNSYCVWADYTNLCEAQIDTNLLKQHCSISLKGENDILKVQLSWSPYVGEDVVEYNIYRKIEGGSWNLLAKQPNSILRFADTNFVCPRKVQYKVIAALEKGWSTESNHIINTPYGESNGTVYPILNVSTISDQIHLFLPEVESSTEVVLVYKGDKELINSGLDKEVIDKTSDITTVNYYYTENQDYCDSLGVQSGFANNIVLQQKQGENKFNYKLSWNKPIHWQDKFDGYVLQQSDGDEQFYSIRSFTTEDSLFYYQTVPHSCLSGKIKLRIAAFYTISKDTVYALSNQVEVIPVSTLFAPTAFSPNKDGINDYFEPKGSSIHGYELIIFNRWGEQLFKTEACLQGWDGSYNGQVCQEGVYKFIIYAQGIDGKRHNLKGEVTLLK